MGPISTVLRNIRRKTALTLCMFPCKRPLNCKRHHSAISFVANRQIGVIGFKYVGKFAPYASVTWYSICAVAANALSMVSLPWELSELISQERICLYRTLKFGGGVYSVTRHVWLLTKVKRSKIKVTRSRNVSVASTIYRQRMVVSTSNMV